MLYCYYFDRIGEDIALKNIGFYEFKRKMMYESDFVKKFQEYSN